MVQINIEIPEKFTANLMASQIQAATSAAISSTLMAVKSQWEQVAQTKLRSTRADYMLGLNADDSLQFPDAFTGILTLRGKWPNMLESGFGSFDIKDGFQRSSSPKKHMTANGGWYFNIPFRHLTPQATGAGAKGTPMPQDIYAKAQVLMAGERLKGTEADHPPQVSWTGYEHTNGLYEDMKKVSKVYNNAKQSQYMTWRRLSSNSDPSSFMHPGFAGIHAMDTVVPFAKQTLQQVFTAYLSQMG